MRAKHDHIDPYARRKPKGASTVHGQTYGFFAKLGWLRGHRCRYDCARQTKPTATFVARARSQIKGLAGQGRSTLTKELEHDIRISKCSVARVPAAHDRAPRGCKPDIDTSGGLLFLPCVFENVDTVLGRAGDTFLPTFVVIACSEDRLVHCLPRHLAGRDPIQWPPSLVTRTRQSIFSSSRFFCDHWVESAVAGGDVARWRTFRTIEDQLDVLHGETQLPLTMTGEAAAPTAASRDCMRRSFGDYFFLLFVGRQSTSHSDHGLEAVSDAHIRCPRSRRPRTICSDLVSKRAAYDAGGRKNHICDVRRLVSG